MKYLGYAMVFLVCVLGGASVGVGQQIPQSLATALTNQVTRQLHFVPSGEAKVAPLKEAIMLPSTATLNAQNATSLAAIWRLPTIEDGGLLSISGDIIPAELLKFFSDRTQFELGYAKLNAPTHVRLDKALAVLFAAPPDRSVATAKYTAYRDWQAKRNALIAEMDKATNAATKVALNQQLNVVDQDYKLTGDKEFVEAALQVVSESTTEAPQFEDQLRRLKELGASDYVITNGSRLLGRVTSPSAWVRIAADVDAAQIPRQILATLRTAGGAQVDYKLQLKGISYQAIVIPVEHPELSAEVLGNRAWRRKDGQVVSDGNPNVGNGAAPRYISHVLVIRDLDLEFDPGADDYQAFGQSLPSATGGAIAGLSLRPNGAGAAYMLPAHLYLSPATIVAGVVAVTPKAPNALPDLEWK